MRGKRRARSGAPSPTLAHWPHRQSRNGCVEVPQCPLWVESGHSLVNGREDRHAGNMEHAPRSKEKPLRSTTVERLRTLLFLTLTVACSYCVVRAVITGSTVFPARYNRTVVTVTSSPGWFIPSLLAWLAFSGLAGWVTFRCWTRFNDARRRPH